jgi:hypothetical protein
MVDGDGDGDIEQRAEAVLNQMPSNWDIANQFIPKEIEQDNRTCRTPSPKIVEITTKR